MHIHRYRSASFTVPKEVHLALKSDGIRLAQSSVSGAAPYNGVGKIVDEYRLPDGRKLHHYSINGRCRFEAEDRDVHDMIVELIAIHRPKRCRKLKVTEKAA